MMTFLGDLDRWAWLMTGLSLVVCAGILGRDFYKLRLKLPVQSRSAWMYLGALALPCAGGIYNTLSNASDAPHKVVTGPILNVHRSSAGHGSYSYSARVLDSSGSLLSLSFDVEAFEMLKEHRADHVYRVGYLDDPQDFYQNGKQGFYFKLVDIDDVATNDSYYHFDTRHHPVRAAFYLGDILILLLTALIVSRMADDSPDTEDDFENYREPGADRGPRDTLTSLHLN